MGTSCSSVWLQADPSPSPWRHCWGGGGELEHQHLPGPNTQLQVLLVSKAVPDSPLGDSVLVATVLEGPHRFHASSPSLGRGSPLAPARDGTGRDCSHGSPPTWHRSSHAPPQGWRRAEDPLLQRREGWLAARLVPLSSQSPSWSRDWNVFSEENTAEATAGRLWGHFSRGGCLTAAGSWHGTLLWLCHPAAGSPIPATCYLSNKNIWIYFF